MEREGEIRMEGCMGLREYAEDLCKEGISSVDNKTLRRA